MHSYHVAMAHGISDAGYSDLVASLDVSVAAVDGHGFRVTPFFRSRELSESLAFSATGGVWIKNETETCRARTRAGTSWVCSYIWLSWKNALSYTPETAATWRSRAAGTRHWPRPWWPGPAAGGSGGSFRPMPTRA